MQSYTEMSNWAHRIPQELLGLISAIRYAGLDWHVMVVGLAVSHRLHRAP